ncbi:hypothetical protein P389DRAFT_173879 [Cystobasidium minutum MCA 4210]|uniref:uncharacterized protein n=1 Tax=Cystobasidium minutum MCA 4210 TaxID=1397322 RepID=UPI0034CDA9F5|eukprot:jgi/Rhomi1/173879/fgenesh1_kg.6_\
MPITRRQSTANDERPPRPIVRNQRSTSNPPRRSQSSEILPIIDQVRLTDLRSPEHSQIPADSRRNAVPGSDIRPRSRASVITVVPAPTRSSIEQSGPASSLEQLPSTSHLSSRVTFPINKQNQVKASQQRAETFPYQPPPIPQDTGRLTAKTSNFLKKKPSFRDLAKKFARKKKD